MLQILLIILVLVLAVPIGYLLAYLCRDELKDGRKYFKLLVFLSAILGIVFLFLDLIVGLSLIFISVVSLISLIKSYNKNL